MSHRLTRPAAATAAALLAVAVLAACGSDDDGSDTGSDTTPTTSQSATSTGSPSASETAASDPDRTVIEVTMTGGKVEPAPDTVEVEKGTKVRIVVTRDTDGGIHVHGLEEELDAEAKAGVPANLDFTATTQGSFEVEAHDPDRSLLTVQVR